MIEALWLIITMEPLAVMPIVVILLASVLLVSRQIEAEKKEAGR